MDIKKENNLISEIKKTKRKIRNGLVQQRLSDTEISIKMLILDIDFIWHIQINQTFANYPNGDKRLKIYLNYLKIMLKKRGDSDFLCSH